MHAARSLPYDARYPANWSRLYSDNKTSLVVVVVDRIRFAFATVERQRHLDVSPPECRHRPIKTNVRHDALDL
jgi:hypothetical protein